VRKAQEPAEEGNLKPYIKEYRIAVPCQESAFYNRGTSDGYRDGKGFHFIGGGHNIGLSPRQSCFMFT
jgi:hypothetical protein